MTKVILNGALGRMGQMVAERSAGNKDYEILAGVDAVLKTDDTILREKMKTLASALSFPVYSDLTEIPDSLKNADVIIDFSNASGVDQVLDFCADNLIAVVLCTTGLSDDTLRHIDDASKKIPVLRSANMSLGINLMMKILKEAAPVLANAGFDIEIVEKHHNQKLDAPSGTAIALADSINNAFDDPYEYVFDRSGRRQVRPNGEIGISAVRGGSIVGDHDVIFAGKDEVFTISHQAYSRAIFANGALQAAGYLAKMAPGLYGMEDVL